MQPILSDFQERLVRGLAHRMNNILSLFHGYLGMLMDNRKLDSITREGLNKIRDGARVAAELMERTNAISRPASGVLREVNPAEFFRQLAPALDGLRDPKLRIDVECPENTPRIWVDPSRLKLAVIELVRNACEAAASTVSIRATVSEDSVQAELFPGSPAAASEQWVKIGVSDDGPGIPISETNRIYDPFYSTKKTQQCAGLGLSVALGCARQFGGELSHRSRKGSTTFELILPARAPEEFSAVA